MGPLNNEPTAQKMDEHVADAVERGAELVAGGSRASGFPTDLYWQPTVLAEVTRGDGGRARGDVRPRRPDRARSRATRRRCRSRTRRRTAS